MAGRDPQTRRAPNRRFAPARPGNRAAGAADAARGGDVDGPATAHRRSSTCARSRATPSSRDALPASPPPSSGQNRNIAPAQGARQAGGVVQRQTRHLPGEQEQAAGGDGVTQFGRALSALNIDIICANSPQAKGRIERAFGTLQDRMVKELRLAGVSSMAAANAWLPGFITAYNTRFGRDPANTKDLHRPLRQGDDLDEILAWREERTVTRNLTLHYDRMMLLLDPTPLARGLVRKKVEVVNYPDGRFAVQFNGATLGFKVFDKIQTVQPGAIVDNKRLSAVLEQIKAQQAAYPPHQQRGHIARQRPPNNLEAPGLPSKGRAPRHAAAAAPAGSPPLSPLYSVT